MMYLSDKSETAAATDVMHEPVLAFDTRRCRWRNRQWVGENVLGIISLLDANQTAHVLTIVRF